MKSLTIYESYGRLGALKEKEWMGHCPWGYVGIDHRTGEEVGMVLSLPRLMSLSPLSPHIHHVNTRYPEW